MAKSDLFSLVQRESASEQQPTELAFLFPSFCCSCVNSFTSVYSQFQSSCSFSFSHREVPLMNNLAKVNHQPLFVNFNCRALRVFVFWNIPVVRDSSSVLCGRTVVFLGVFYTSISFLGLHHIRFPTSSNVIFRELSHAQGREVKSVPPLPSHFETPASNTSCRVLQNGTSPHSADTFSHLVSHRDGALSQTAHRKEKSWKAFYVNIDQLELPPKESRPQHVLANGCRGNVTSVVVTFFPGCTPFKWLYMYIPAPPSHFIRHRIPGRCT